MLGDPRDPMHVGKALRTRLDARLAPHTGRTGATPRRVLALLLAFGTRDAACRALGVDWREVAPLARDPVRAWCRWIASVAYRVRRVDQHAAWRRRTRAPVARVQPWRALGLEAPQRFLPRTKRCKVPN